MQCSKCGCSLANENAKRSHERVCEGDSSRATVDDILERHDEYSGYTGHPCVYVAEISHGGEEFYYVGESLALKQRLLEHAADQAIVAIPDENTLVSTCDYQLVGLHDFELLPDSGTPVRKKREREWAYELAIETGRTDILGGR